jgi:hypothetical protein
MAEFYVTAHTHASLAETAAPNACLQGEARGSAAAGRRERGLPLREPTSRGVLLRSVRACTNSASAVRHAAHPTNSRWRQTRMSPDATGL